MGEEERKSRFQKARELFSSGSDPAISDRKSELTLSGLSIDEQAPPPVPPPPVPKRPAPSQPVQGKPTPRNQGLALLSNLGAYKKVPLLMEYRIPASLSPTPSADDTREKKCCLALWKQCLLVTSFNQLYLADIPSGTCVKQTLIPALISCLHCTSEGILWLGTSDGSIYLFDLSAEGNMMPFHHRSFAHSNHPVEQILPFGEDMLSLDSTGVLIQWPKKALTLNSRAIILPIKTRKIFVSSDGKLLVSTGKILRVFGLDEELHEIAALDPADFNMVSISAISDVVEMGEKLAVFHEDGKILVWSTANRVLLFARSFGTSYRVQSAQIVGLDKIWVAFTTGRVSVIEITEEESPASWKIYAEWKTQDSALINVLGEDQFVAGATEDSVVYLWDARLKQASKFYAMRLQLDKFSRFTDETVLVCSWNVGACKPPSIGEDTFWHEWLAPVISPSMIVVGLQEVICLESKRANAKLLLGSGENTRFSLWIDRLKQAISDSQPAARYRLIMSHNLVGLLLAVFIREDQIGLITFSSCDAIKTGLGGLHGNKGSLAARIIYRDSSLSMINCHLAAGHEKVASRNSDAGMILKTAKFMPAPHCNEQVFSNGGDGSCVDDMEHCFFFGDLNYRIDIGRRDAISLIESEQLSHLSTHDQIACQLAHNPSFPLLSFQEGPLSFPPTYKFDPHSDTYDTSEKMRVPAWCDRILYRCSTGEVSPKGSIEQYGSVSSAWHSDHRPVHAVIRIPIKNMDQDKFNSLKIQF